MEPPFPAVPGLLCLLAAAAASSSGAAECPSSAWIPFGSSCYIFLQGSLNELDSIDDVRDLCKGNASGADIISIKNKEENTFIQETFKNHWQGPDYILLGMFFDTDDNAFKWFDKSEMKFTNWIEEESNEELLNTCASMHTKSGGWRKISCEDLPLTGTLCKTASAYEKMYLPGVCTGNLIQRSSSSQYTEMSHVTCIQSAQSELQTIQTHETGK
ncbi:CD302 antigen isoform X2 [Emydura macquarii macquarii]|uniref:CD302 antigen isoform X2 n=1 Tax=Emydura macquarii macquarii TaxID=1129001 RepID=UPI00352A5783